MDGVVKKIQAMCAGRSDEHLQKRAPTLLTDAPSHSMMHNTLLGGAFKPIRELPGAAAEGFDCGAAFCALTGGE